MVWILMPRISHFHGADIYMYWNDHLPPHFHALHGDDEALIEFNPPRLYRGNLPRRVLRLVLDWAAQHPAQLDHNWQLARGGQPLVQIPPLP
jgi:Domain of unknown function (DUF4160)